MATAKRLPTGNLSRRAKEIRCKSQQSQAAQAVARLAAIGLFSTLTLPSSSLAQYTFEETHANPTAFEVPSYLILEQVSGEETPEAVNAGSAQLPATTDDQSTAARPSATNAETVEAQPLNEDDAKGDAQQDPLKLADVVASLYRSYPEIIRARQQMQVAGGDLFSAYGAYDTKFEGYSLSEPTGFYRNYRHGLGLARQTWWGGYAAAGYRIGRGQFQPWYKERETNEAGEFKIALSQPLLQGRAIDAERVAVFQASLGQQSVGPLVQQAILDISFDATALYWEWVAMGAVLHAQKELFELAKLRGEQFEVGVKAGKFPEIDLILNQQLIAERNAKVFETEQKYRATSFKLSLYLRDPVGQPLVPDDSWLPERFPKIELPPTEGFQSDLIAAIARRPEPQLLQIEMRQIQLERDLANNNLLPRLDVVTEASQDVGTPASSSNDKGQFELLVGVTSEVPIQRRKARGKIQSTTGKISQINEKLRLTQDKIAAELQAAYNALQLSSQVVEQSELSLRAALETLDRYRFAFNTGKIDLIYLNLLETKANETEIKVVEAQRQWFIALAQMQRALGLDPLEQAINVAALPDNDAKNAGFLENRPPFQGGAN